SASAPRDSPAAVRVLLGQRLPSAWHISSTARLRKIRHQMDFADCNPTYAADQSSLRAERRTCSLATGKQAYLSGAGRLRPWAGLLDVDLAGDDSGTSGQPGP